MEMKPLFDDEFNGAPAKRALSHLLKHRENDTPIVGVYCSYAPLEIPRAMGVIPAVLCAFANSTIAAGETALPANLCPLIKSSYGFIQTDTCPFFSISQAVIGETTCDGKKKMFELIADKKPTFVMDLPQVPNNESAHSYWRSVVGDMRTFLEETFNKKAGLDELESAISDTNEKNRLVQRFFSYAALNPPVITWQEMLDVVFLATPLPGSEVNPILEDKILILEERLKNGLFAGVKGAPRVLVTGSPLGGDATKVYRTIEEEGGVVVAIDSCVGNKIFASNIDSNTGDPMDAIARRYLAIPCSCMTPNLSRLEALSMLIEKYRPDVVIDVVLQACHSYNVESAKVEKHVRGKHGLHFLKIVTDYSSEDVGQMRTRIGATFEMIGQK